MNASRFYFCAIPESIWNPNEKSVDVSFSDLAAEAIDAERRIIKGVNTDSESQRYTLLCQNIERKVLACDRLKLVVSDEQFSEAVKANNIPMIVSPPGLLALLAYSQEESANQRLGACFYPPDQVEEQLHVFTELLVRNNLNHVKAAKKRSEFLKHAYQLNCGIVEVQSAFLALDESAVLSNWELYTAKAQKESEHENFGIPDYDSTGEAITYFKDKSKQQVAQQLRDQIREALENNEPITIGNQARHDVITEVLHELVFAGGSNIRPAFLRIVYVDGSEGEPFPIFCLPKLDSVLLNDNEILNSALMSIRHYELDDRIDFCWFRNREVSQSRTLAESDSFCYKTSQSQLSLALKDGDFGLNLYHTGFEPAVIGFYRALVDAILSKTQRHIFVRPMYFRGDNYENGSLWIN